ncbi:MAG: hypothetical protein HYR84_14140 [Planctomycetes bacterium]|nr:hypothetical protein [Planctomycetota bacterium]
MFRTARMWKGALPWTLGGVLLSGAWTLAGDPPTLTEQLLGLGRQAQNQGRKTEAASFFRKVLELDPANAEAKKALSDRAGLVRLIARQDPKPGDQPAPADQPQALPNQEKPAATQATIEKTQQLEKVLIQQVTHDTRERMQKAREAVSRGEAQAALEILRLAQAAVQTDEQVPQDVRDTLGRELQTQIQATVRKEEELSQQRAEQIRLEQSSQQRARILDQLAQNQDTVNALMTQFDALMAEGIYNVLFQGGTGDIKAATKPFYDARLISQHARALERDEVTPRAGIAISQYMGFFAQTHQFEELKEYRYMLTLQDVERAAVPFPDTITIEYPPAEHFREITEKRIKRYESVSLESTDAKTQAINASLEKPISMPFQAETPLEDVIKYIQSATRSNSLPEGIPIYVDPIGLQEAEKTLTSPITLNLEGVTLKKCLKLLLKQLDLTYTVKDGLMTITSTTSKDQPTEIRVYPVADLAIIPFSLMGGGGGGMGGMGGGMGGMGGGMGGGGMGGMGGGGMGGMGGGMGGGGMGGGGFRSIPAAPQDPSAGQVNPFAEKKSN